VDAWLQCRNPEEARSFLRPFPAERMKTWAAPKEPKKPRAKEAAPETGSLF
jgi:putative SOS response-associated peptidase YedK